MIIVLFRTIILYGVVLISMRIMGKGELGDLQPFDLVVSLMLADLAIMPMEDLDAPLSYGITSITTIMFLQCLISYITLKSSNARKIICGRPSIIIDHGKFNTKEMNKLRVNVNDVLGQMRLKGYYNVEDIDYLIMETNGEMSIIGPTEAPGVKCNRIPISVILDSKVMYKNLEKFKIEENKLDEELRKNNLKLNEIIYGFVDENDKFVFYKR
ncbi:uncharacterized membrane protein YcaP (DUF421 family) [Sedimentibacter acidaminivorans]|jgi:uncharacterized membrane protein YcaP (DUF421 family)|uniref:Uncharacterized membrane protein YcaP (DUF421 family) n=1 Tax=Sedimentibacter acidaminivorans TaxID=913099 RepID=A0ABS4GEL3_9FIRM|nr:DUF421 domain-containing protein [Sedimentibacter acidaminivorans]MBP1926137.1 uncharacterized membrane protein YcaP (DUF421 family) [Sedimentibacter acidaminivorans]